MVNALGSPSKGLLLVDFVIPDEILGQLLETDFFKMDAGDLALGDIPHPLGQQSFRHHLFSAL